jgi:hypothetical protein
MRLRFRLLRKRIWLKFVKASRRMGNEPVRRKPEKMTESEKTACDIFMELLHNKESKLHYDIRTQECYLSSADKTLYAFLESRNVKIINSVFGYDVHISGNLEAYLLEKFIKEMAIRRNAFKTEVLSKINHSLDLTLEKLKTANNGNRKNEAKQLTANAQ